MMLLVDKKVGAAVLGAPSICLRRRQTDMYLGPGRANLAAPVFLFDFRL
jgi:hypothetical protein